MEYAGSMLKTKHTSLGCDTDTHSHKHKGGRLCKCQPHAHHTDNSPIQRTGTTPHLQMARMTGALFIWSHSAMVSWGITYNVHYDYDYEFPDNWITITQLTTMKLFVIQIHILLLLLSKLWLLLSRPLSSWPHCCRGHRCCHGHPRSWSCGYCRCSCVPAPPTIVSASTMATTLVCASLDANAVVTTKWQCHKHRPAHSGKRRENRVIGHGILAGKYLAKYCDLLNSSSLM